MSDHFSRVAADYAAYRPRYPAELFQWLGSIAPGRRLAWDAGTGNGQAALGLVPFFDRIVASDLSQDQIAEAEPHPAIEYQVMVAEKSGLPDASVDLVTVAQALHWFDTDLFFREVRRVLVPSGAVVAWTYGVVYGDSEPVSEQLHQFYYDEIGPWWPENRKLVETAYRTITFPFTEIPAPPFSMTVRWTLPELLGYIGTWSAVSRYRQDRKRDPLEGLVQRLAAPWGRPEIRRTITWPLSVLAGRS